MEKNRLLAISLKKIETEREKENRQQIYTSFLTSVHLLKN